MLAPDIYRHHVEQARATDLGAVLEALGAQRDRYDRHKYRLPDSIISITNDLFYDHVQERGGRGAISLVMHVQQWDFKEAIQYLLNSDPWPILSRDTTGGRARNLSDATRADSAQFVAPERAEHFWPEVRAYLAVERGIPAHIVDNLHAMGFVYADPHHNAVFLRRDADGHPTGAALRSTSLGSTFKGLARGTHRDAGYFYYDTGHPQPYSTPSLIILESAIDAMSLHGLHLSQGQQTSLRLLSTDGAGALPFPFIDTALRQGWTVQAAFDNDRAGDRFWQQVRDHYPIETDPTHAHHVIWREVPPHGKDWNDTLHDAQNHSSRSIRADHHDYSR